MKKLFYFNLLLTFSICVLSLRSAEKTQEIKITLDNYPVEERKMLFFASELYNRKEYYRAITEFMRVNSYGPENGPGIKSCYLIAESYFLSEKWEDALRAYGQFIDNYPSDELVYDAEYKTILCYAQLKHFRKVSELYGKYAEMPQKHKWNDTMEYVNALSLIYQRKWKESIDFIGTAIKNNPDSVYNAKYKQLKNGISAYASIPSKSINKAGLLSAFLPGAGQVYAKKSGDGFMAFALTGISVATAINCHINKADFGTVVFGILGLSFYSANIYNAMNDARKYNEEYQDKFYSGIAETAREESLFKAFTIEINTEGNYILLKY